MRERRSNERVVEEKKYSKSSRGREKKTHALSSFLSLPIILTVILFPICLHASTHADVTMCAGAPACLSLS